MSGRCERKQGETLTESGVEVAIFPALACSRKLGALFQSLIMQNIPTWVVIAVGIANVIQIFSALVMILLGVIVVGILLQIKNQLTQDIVPTVASTLRNVEKMSVDAAATTHNVTGALNRVSNLVGSAANRLESPIIRVVGMASGLLAAGRAVRGGKKTVVVEKKRKGLF